MAKKLVKVCIGIGLIAGAGLFLSSRFIVKFFDFTPQGIDYMLIILAIYSVMLIVKIYNALLITGVLRAGGDTTFAAVSEISCVWLIGVPAAFIGALVLELPVYYVVMLVALEEVVKLFILRSRYRGMKWVRNLVRNIEK